MTDWMFAPIASEFRSHVREQLPWYEVATSLTCDLATHFITRSSAVYDLGAADGNIGRSLSQVLKQRECDFIPIEADPTMAETYTGPGTVVVRDAADVEYLPFSVTISFLTLMFLAPPDRKRLLARIIKSCEPGGAIILVERMLPMGGEAGLAFTRSVLIEKLRNGADPAAVATKEVSLAGVQRPLSLDELPSGSIPFFRAYDFVGWLWTPNSEQ